MPTCEGPGCEVKFEAGRRGRPRRYCSAACRQAAYRHRSTLRRRRFVYLIEADARDYLPRLGAGHADLVLTDPPYFFLRTSSRPRAAWFAQLTDDAWPALFAGLYHALRPDSRAYVFSDARTKPLFDHAAAAGGFTVRAPLVWDKCSIGMGGAWRSQYELINWYEKGTPPMPRDRSRGDVRHHPRVRGYPTEKPLGLLRELIGSSTSPGDRVLDPFAGSGGVGRAAAMLGRYATLVDVDAAAAARRLRISPHIPIRTHANSQVDPLSAPLLS